MLVNTITILSLTATLVNAFRIPAGTLDGVYSVTKDSSGADVFELLSLTSDEVGQSASPASRILRALSKRGQTWCGCGSGVDHGDTDSANAALQKTVGNGKTVPSRGSIVSVKGSTAAFFCNYDGSDTTARKPEAVAGASTITNACGWYIAGTNQIDGHPHLDFGYLNKFNGNVCDAAEGSPAHHC